MVNKITMNQVRILFINPQSRLSDATTSPPLGVLFISSYIKKKFKDKIKVKFIDLNLKGERLDAVKKFNPAIVGIPVLTDTCTESLRLAESLKSLLPNTKIVAGGHHITAMPDTFYPNIDCLIIGEGEKSFAEIVLLVIQGKPLPASIRADGFLEDVNFIPDVDLIDDYGRYIPQGNTFLFRPQALVLGSRGCHFSCNFCASVMWRNGGPRIRARTPENVVDEIEYLYNTRNIKNFHFADDELNFSTEYLTEICREVILRNLKIRWVSSLRIDIKFNPPSLIKLMAQAGCYSVGFGIESSDQEVINHIRKGFAIEDVEETLEMYKKYKVKVHGLFTIGHIWEKNNKVYGETEEQVQETIVFIKYLYSKYLLFTSSVSIITPYPGSGIYDICKKHNLLYDTSFHEVLNRQRLIFQHPEISPEKMNNLYNRAWIATVFNRYLILNQIKTLRHLSMYPIFVKYTFRVLRKVFDNYCTLLKGIHA